MNHDATHCLDYCKRCPQVCYRAELTKELRQIYYPFPVSWAHLEGTEECMKTIRTTCSDRYRQYEEAKSKLPPDLTPKQYEAEIKKLAEKFRI